MNNRVKILILFIFINGSILHADCFEKSIVMLGENLEYPEIGKILSSSIAIHFNLSGGIFVLDTTNSLRNKKLLEPIINKIQRSDLLAKCDNKPQFLTVRFNVSVMESVKYQNHELIITKLFEPSYREYAIYYADADIIYDLKGIDIKNGKSIVFIYKINNRNPFLPENRMDERIFFQIPNGINEFTYKNKDLKGIKLFYKNVCMKGCKGVFIENGEIKGKIEDEYWIIDIQFHGREFKIKYKNS